MKSNLKKLPLDESPDDLLDTKAGAEFVKLGSVYLSTLTTAS